MNKQILAGIALGAFVATGLGTVYTAAKAQTPNVQGQAGQQGGRPGFGGQGVCAFAQSRAGDAPVARAVGRGATQHRRAIGREREPDREAGHRHRGQALVHGRAQPVAVTARRGMHEDASRARAPSSHPKFPAPNAPALSC